MCAGERFKSVVDKGDGGIVLSMIWVPADSENLRCKQKVVFFNGNARISLFSKESKSKKKLRNEGVVPIAFSPGEAPSPFLGTK